MAESDPKGVRQGVYGALGAVAAGGWGASAGVDSWALLSLAGAAVPFIGATSGVAFAASVPAAAVALGEAC